ncbi:hypothetical protein STEG23_016355, partial [Scotinomys teguina]
EFLDFKNLHEHYISIMNIDIMEPNTSDLPFGDNLPLLQPHPGIEIAASYQDAASPGCRPTAAEAEDENLWIASRLIWFNQPRPPDRSSDVPTSRTASRVRAPPKDHQPSTHFFRSCQSEEQRTPAGPNATLTTRSTTPNSGGDSLPDQVSCWPPEMQATKMRGAKKKQKSRNKTPIQQRKSQKSASSTVFIPNLNAQTLVFHSTFGYYES